jgi:hypothetical protein
VLSITFSSFVNLSEFRSLIYTNSFACFHGLVSFKWLEQVDYLWKDIYLILKQTPKDLNSVGWNVDKNLSALGAMD